MLAFEFVCSWFFSSFNCDVRLLIWYLPSFLMWAFSAINFLLNAVLAASQRLWYVVSLFSLVSKNFLISALILLFAQESFRSRLFHLHVVVWFWVNFLVLSSHLCCFLRVCCNFSSFAFAEDECFINTSDYVINFRVSVMWWWEEYIICFRVESSVEISGLLNPELSLGPEYLC